MIVAPIPMNEKERVKDLHSYSILDTLSEEDFDNLTTIASEICDTNISLISLIDSDRQWFKSAHGMDATETERKYSFCAHALNTPNEILIVNDSRKDERFADNPYVKGEPSVVFYAGAPLVSEKGFPLGTLCVIHDQPKTLSDQQINSLKALSKQVMNLIELRKKKNLLERTTERLNEKNKALEKFVYSVAHDLRSPLNNIIGATELLGVVYEIEPDAKEIVEMIKGSSGKLKKLIEDLLEQSKSEKQLRDQVADVLLKELHDALCNLFVFNDKCSIAFHTDLEKIYINKIALEQILINLISNAIKYNDKEISKIDIGITDRGDEYYFYVQDNGKGIPEEFSDKVFDMYETQNEKDRFGEKGFGIGLAIVKELVGQFGGIITFNSTVGVGTRFSFTLKK